MRQACDRHGTRLENIYTCTTTLAQWTHNTLFSTISVTIFFFFFATSSKILRHFFDVCHSRWRVEGSIYTKQFVSQTCLKLVTLDKVGQCKSASRHFTPLFSVRGHSRVSVSLSDPFSPTAANYTTRKCLWEQ